MLLIVQYKYLKSFYGDFYSPESDPPHRIVWYRFYYSIWLGFSFPLDDGNVMYHSCTSLKGASRGGQPLNVFT